MRSINVIVVDDASPDAKRARTVASDGKVYYTRNDENAGFAATANRGAALGTSDIIIFLNSDVYVTEGCLYTLNTKVRDETIGIVGGKLLFAEDTPHGPAGKVQHAGLAFAPTQEPFHIHIGWSADNPRVNRSQEVQAVTGALMAVDRAMFEEVGGFQEVYGRGTFEDIELCVASRLSGKRVWYEPEAVAYHHVGASIVESNVGYPLEHNFRIFRARCAQYVAWDEWALW